MSSDNPIRRPTHVVPDPPFGGAAPPPTDEEVSVTLTILGRPVRAKVVASGETLQGLRAGNTDTLTRVAAWVQEKLFTHLSADDHRLSAEDHRLVAARQLINREPAVTPAGLSEEHLVKRLLAPGTVIERGGVTSGLGVPIAGEDEEDDLASQSTDALLVPPSGGTRRPSAQVQETANRIEELVRGLSTRFGGIPRLPEDRRTELEEESLAGSPLSSLSGPSGGTGRLSGIGQSTSVAEEGLQYLADWCETDPNSGMLVDRTWARYSRSLELAAVESTKIALLERHFRALFKTGAAQVAALDALASPSEGITPSDAQRIEKLVWVQEMLESTWDDRSTDYLELKRVVGLPGFSTGVENVLARVDTLIRDELVASHSDLEFVNRMNLARTALKKAFAALEPLPIFTPVQPVEERQAAFDIAVRALRRVYKDEKSGAMQLFRWALRLPAEAPPPSLSTGPESLDANASDLTPRRSPVRREPLFDAGRPTSVANLGIGHDGEEFFDVETEADITPSSSGRAPPPSPISLDQSLQSSQRTNHLGLDKSRPPARREPLFPDGLPETVEAGLQRLKEWYQEPANRELAKLALVNLGQQWTFQYGPRCGERLEGIWFDLFDNARSAAQTETHRWFDQRTKLQAHRGAFQFLHELFLNEWDLESPGYSELREIVGHPEYRQKTQSVLVALRAKIDLEQDRTLKRRLEEADDRLTQALSFLERMLHLSGVDSDIWAAQMQGAFVVAGLAMRDAGLQADDDVWTNTARFREVLGLQEADEAPSLSSWSSIADGRGPSRLTLEQRLDALRVRANGDRERRACFRLEKWLQLKQYAPEDNELYDAWSTLFDSPHTSKKNHDGLVQLAHVLGIRVFSTDDLGLSPVMGELESFVDQTWWPKVPNDIKTILNRLEPLAERSRQPAFLYEIEKRMEQNQRVHGAGKRLESDLKELKKALEVFVNSIDPAVAQAGFDRLVELLKTWGIGGLGDSGVQVVNSILDKLPSKT